MEKDKVIDTEKTARLETIFQKIYELNTCGEDPLKVKRNILETNPNATLMTIAEAMAPEQVRLSGTNFFYPNGEVGNTGRNLEKFLNHINQTIYPHNPNCIYHTEIVHNFPGYTERAGKRYIRRPTREEIELSIQSEILEEEIEIIKPKVILLMGDTAYRTFYKHILQQEPLRSLSDEITHISETGEFHKYKNTPLIPIQHSSGANPRFNSMLQNTPLIDLINNLLYT